MSRFLRATLVLAPFAAAALLACEGSGDSGGGSGSFEAADGGFDGATGALPDGSVAADADAEAADAAGAARAAELAKMQAHLDSLYAPSDVVHTFTTPLGDKVDCLPFQRQPGFSKVNSLNGATPIDQLMPPSPVASSEAGLGTGVDADGNTRGCPSGAVPIRHLALSDLARFNTLDDFLAKAPDYDLVIPDLHQHANYIQLDTPNWGAQATLNLWKPAVEPDDFSLSQIWVSDTAPSTQSVEAGYTEYPLGYGSEDPRLFIYSTADNYSRTDTQGCYDLDCKSFIQLADSHILLGGRFDKTSVMNGEQRVFRLRYQYCPASQCKDWEGWWLHYEGGTLSEWIGFYPSTRFGNGPLHDGSGTRVDFGGEVFVPAGVHKTHTTTDMGSGAPPSSGFGVAAYQTDLLVISPGNQWERLGTPVNSSESPACYNAGPLMPASDDISAIRLPSESFYFGGTGQSAECP